MEPENLNIIKARMISAFLILVTLVWTVFSFCGCSVNYQNICTKGIAEDVVDDIQKGNPTVSPTLTLPVNPL